MPDPCHVLATFPPHLVMRNVVWTWKGYVAKRLSIAWQRDFFEHRLRSDERFEEKARYIRQNPVRAELVATAEDWPYIWDQFD